MTVPVNVRNLVEGLDGRRDEPSSDLDRPTRGIVSITDDQAGVDEGGEPFAD